MQNIHLKHFHKHQQLSNCTIYVSSLASSLMLVFHVIPCGFLNLCTRLFSVLASPSTCIACFSCHHVLVTLIPHLVMPSFRLTSILLIFSIHASSFHHLHLSSQWKATAVLVLQTYLLPSYNTNDHKTLLNVDSKPPHLGTNKASSMALETEQVITCKGIHNK